MFPSTPAPTHTCTHSPCLLPGTEQIPFCRIPSAWSSAPSPALAAPSTPLAPPRLAASHSGAFCTHSSIPNNPARYLSCIAKSTDKWLLTAISTYNQAGICFCLAFRLAVVFCLFRNFQQAVKASPQW